MIVKANCQRAAITASAMVCAYNRSSMRRLRRFIGVLCILAVIAGALLAPATGGMAPAVLVPLGPLFGLIVLAVVRAADPTPAYAYRRSAPQPSRAPPSVA